MIYIGQTFTTRKSDDCTTPIDVTYEDQSLGVVQSSISGWKLVLHPLKQKRICDTMMVVVCEAMRGLQRRYWTGERGSSSLTGSSTEVATTRLEFVTQ